MTEIVEPQVTQPRSLERRCEAHATLARVVGPAGLRVTEDEVVIVRVGRAPEVVFELCGDRSAIGTARLALPLLGDVHCPRE